MIGQAQAIFEMTPTVDVSPEAAADRLGRLFDAHQARLYRLARRMTNSTEEARDAVQETFLRAAKSPRSIPDGASNEEAWLVRVLINICRDGWRKQAVRRRVAASEPIARVDHGASESSLIARAAIWRGLAALAPRRRAILVLYEIEGAAIPTIAQLLGIRAVTVRWHLSIGRRELARFLGMKSLRPTKRSPNVCATPIPSAASRACRSKRSRRCGGRSSQPRGIPNGASRQGRASSPSPPPRRSWRSRPRRSCTDPA